MEEALERVQMYSDDFIDSQFELTAKMARAPSVVIDDYSFSRLKLLIERRLQKRHERYQHRSNTLEKIKKIH